MAEQTENSKEIPAVLLFPFVPYSLIPFVIYIPGLGPEPPHLLPGLERQEPEDLTQYVADITLLPQLLPALERQEPAELPQQAGDWSLLCLLVSVCANI
jgi:hypothetical protein